MRYECMIWLIYLSKKWLWIKETTKHQTACLERVCWVGHWPQCPGTKAPSSGTCRRTLQTTSNGSHLHKWTSTAVCAAKHCLKQARSEASAEAACASNSPVCWEWVRSTHPKSSRKMPVGCHSDCKWTLRLSQCLSHIHLTGSEWHSAKQTVPALLLATNAFKASILVLTFTLACALCCAFRLMALLSSFLLGLPFWCSMTSRWN